MKIPKTVFFLSVAANLVLVAGLIDYAVFKSAKVKTYETPGIFPVVLIQKINSELHALNLFSEKVQLDKHNLEAAEIIDQKVETTKIIRTPLTISWADKTSPFPSDFAKEAPAVVDINEIPQCRICQIKDNSWIIKKGNYQLNEMLIIPADVNFSVEAGAIITFGSDGGIFSRSAINANGAQFKGMAWKGITILNQSEVTSVMSKSRVEGGNGFEIFGMKYTGTLNFILGKIKLSELEFENSQSEDALNVKWVSGEIEKTSFKNSLSDAFDADWSELTISDLNFKNAKNDCLDFSGGKVLITNIQLTGCQDKAISNGENNILVVDTVSISQSKTAIANKDGAKIKLSNTSIKNSETALHQYHQKMFYPEPATELGTALTIDQVTTFQKVEAGKVTGHESL